jgi:hypothetical protein
MWIVDFQNDLDPINITSIRNLQSEIKNPMAPLRHKYTYLFPGFRKLPRRVGFPH